MWLRSHTLGISRQPKDFFHFSLDTADSLPENSRMRKISLSPLRRRRVLAGLTLREISNLARVNIGKLSEAERGFLSLTPEQAERVTRAIDKLTQERAAG